MAGAVQTLRDIEATTLTNGVRVISEEMPHVRSVSLGVWIRTGSRRETSEENGISHFIEHMVFKGTKNRSAEEIARSVDSIGGGLDAFTAKEMVSYNTKVLDEHLPLAFDVLADMVRNPLFREEDIEKEKGVILEELKMEVDNPEYLLHDIFSSNFWKDHPLGKPILGTKDTVRAFDRRMIGDYYRRYYSPSNILITAAGNLNHERLVDLARQHFEDLRMNGTLAPDVAPVPHARLVFPQQDFARADASVHGRAGLSVFARAALRLLCAEHHSGRRHEFAAVPEHPRKAGLGLRRVFRARHVSRHRLHGHLRGHGRRNGGQSG